VETDATSSTKTTKSHPNLVEISFTMRFGVRLNKIEKCHVYDEDRSNVMYA
jgi:hypothetical protein